MANIEKVSLIGMGAIGCVYGSKLLDALPDQKIQVIADAKRIERYQRDGLLINGKRYDFSYVLPDEQAEPSDLIIVSVKANQLAQAIQDMRCHVGKQTIILSLLNGIITVKKLSAKPMAWIKSSMRCATVSMPIVSTTTLASPTMEKFTLGKKKIRLTRKKLKLSKLCLTRQG
ncbi:2-dehydropantoate 2-reductase N-terminal domain-containing protein [Terrilactibacillus sp. S3-3]|nr:2-dehydropantoate 2-reductase N-terminal domain-containing protein [Terrilactibacillus sp. S3-3]